MKAYYNEFDAGAAAWLRELIKANLIVSGDVDERSIKDVQAKELKGYCQCHFFAGIGGWSYALRLANWPDDKPVWTGSCPCQPFSGAGKRLGKEDPRHLWPEFNRLIANGKPAIVFGEQVASKDGKVWLAGVRTDLEKLGYAVGAADLCAAGVGAPHTRQRLYWVANSSSKQVNTADERGFYTSAGGSGIIGRVGNAKSDDQWRSRKSEESIRRTFEDRRSGSWDNFDIKPFLDNKSRRIESGTFPLVDGFPGRVGLLRGYGNAIVPQVAAEFIEASEEAIVSNY